MNFEKFKSLMTTESVLQYFKTEKPVVVQTDASSMGLGGVLIQEGKLVANAFISLSNSEDKYASIELGLMAIVYGMQKFDQYVFENTDVTIHTDHKPQESIMNKPPLKAPAGSKQ